MTKLEKFQSIKKDFGLSFAVRYYYLRETKQYSRYIALVRDYLTSYLRPLIEEYQSVDSNIGPCFWQRYLGLLVAGQICNAGFLQNVL